MEIKYLAALAIIIGVKMSAFASYGTVLGPSEPCIVEETVTSDVVRCFMPHLHSYQPKYIS